ncbi:MAG: hypothetical protein AAF206_27365, partial [Bacteroidota bacterium]
MRRFSVRFFCFVIIICSSCLLFAQDIEADSSRIGTYKNQSRQLVRFVEYMMNTLGNPSTNTRDKEVIINESYRKVFRDAEVQIEDDLEEYRSTVTNKDVQAYLKDIDFFFKEVRFSFEIEELSHELKENGDLFFLVSFSRNLEGINVSGDSVFNNQDRFMEINLDPSTRSLKVASIYTTKLSQKETLANWWNELPGSWRSFFGPSIRLNDSLRMDQILTKNPYVRIGDTIDFVFEPQPGDSLHSDLAYLFEDAPDKSVARMEALVVDGPLLYQDLKQIFTQDRLDVSGQTSIDQLQPLTNMTRLKELNLAGTSVFDLQPLRNLTRLEILNVANTGVSDLAPLRYTINLRELIIHHTLVQDLTPVAQFRQLSKLHIFQTPVRDLGPLAGLRSLQEIQAQNCRFNSLIPLNGLADLVQLNVSGNQVEDLRPLSKMEKLEILYIESTSVKNLQPLGTAKSLRLLFADGARINTLVPLENLSNLRKVYCDRTPVSSTEARRFMNRKPSTLVVYESATLQNWWQGLSSVWRNILTEKVQISNPPDRSELASLTNIQSLDISGRKDISRLEPIQPLVNLKRLIADNSGVSNLEAIKDLVSLEELQLARTAIDDITVLAGLNNLQKLDISYSGVGDLSSLANLKNLRELRADSTRVSRLDNLGGALQLKFIGCDQSQVNKQQVISFLKVHSDALVIFDTPRRQKWWSSMSQSWQSVFRGQIRMDAEPTPQQLHQAVSLKTISVN